MQAVHRTLVLMSTIPLQFLVMMLAGWVNRNQQDVIDYLLEENRILREHRGGKRLRFTDSQRRRLARKYDGSKFRRSGRPKSPADIEGLVLRMARDDSGWGYTRIRGALRNLGHEIDRNTIKRILLENGIQPAPARRRGMSWETFLKSHWGAIAAADFFNVEVLTSVGLIRYFVFFVIDLTPPGSRLPGSCLSRVGDG